MYLWQANISDVCSMDIFYISVVYAQTKLNSTNLCVCVCEREREKKEKKVKKEKRER